MINLDDRKDRWVTIEKTCTNREFNCNSNAGDKEVTGLAWTRAFSSRMYSLRKRERSNLPWLLILEDDATFTPEDICRFRGASWLLVGKSRQMGAVQWWANIPRPGD